WSSSGLLASCCNSLFAASGTHVSKLSRRRSVIAPPPDARKRVAAEGRCGADRIGSYPIRRAAILTLLPQYRDVVLRFLCWRSAERRPLLHQPAPLLEKIAAAVCTLDRAANNVRQRHLGNLAWKVCSLGYPVAEARPKAVCCQVAAPHLSQQLKKRLL